MTATVTTTSFAKREVKSPKKKSATIRYLRLIARRLKVLRRLNIVESRVNFVTRDEVVRAWTASYFLPMLKPKQTARTGKKTFKPHREPGEEHPILTVPRPKKGLRLPRVFAPCKKFETAR